MARNTGWQSASGSTANGASDGFSIVTVGGEFFSIWVKRDGTNDCWAGAMLGYGLSVRDDTGTQEPGNRVFAWFPCLVSSVPISNVWQTSDYLADVFMADWSTTYNAGSFAFDPVDSGTVIQIASPDAHLKTAWAANQSYDDQGDPYYGVYLFMRYPTGDQRIIGYSYFFGSFSATNMGTTETLLGTSTLSAFLVSRSSATAYNTIAIIPQ